MMSKHYELWHYLDNQINMIKIEGKDALMCKEYSSKTHQGGIKDRTVKPPL